MAASGLTPIQAAIVQSVNRSELSHSFTPRSIQMYPILILSDVIDINQFKIFVPVDGKDGTRPSYKVVDPYERDAPEEIDDTTALVQ
jgi:hypothetical protein